MPAHPYVTAVALGRPLGAVPRLASAEAAELAPLACAVALRCGTCGWRAWRAWERAELVASGRGEALGDAVARAARAWVGEPTAEHHRPDAWKLAQLAARGVLEELALGRPPRPYVPGFRGYVRASRVAVVLRDGVAGECLANVELERADDLQEAVARATRARGVAAPADLTGMRAKVTARFAWRRIE